MKTRTSDDPLGGKAMGEYLFDAARYLFRKHYPEPLPAYPTCKQEIDRFIQWVETTGDGQAFVMLLEQASPGMNIITAFCTLAWIRKDWPNY